MANSPKKPDSFDVKAVESLAELMAKHDLTEISVREGQQQIRLRRGGAAPVIVPAAMPLAPALPAKQSPSAEPAAGAVAKTNLIEIKSETVGTYFAQPKPGEPAYVKIGDRVTPTKPVGLVEVMKTYNELQAGCTGTIVEILVKDSQSVEFGQVLFRVDPS